MSGVSVSFLFNVITTVGKGKRKGQRSCATKRGKTKIIHQPVIDTINRNEESKDITETVLTTMLKGIKKGSKVIYK